MTSLNKLFEQRIRDLVNKHVEGKDPEDGQAEAKAKAAIREAETKKMKVKMDEDIEQADQLLRNMAEAQHTTGFWRAWSKIVERSIMEHHDLDKDAIKKLSGRGEVKIIKKYPEQKKTDDNHTSSWDIKKTENNYAKQDDASRWRTV